MSFYEDRNCIPKVDGAENMVTVRHTAVNPLDKEKYLKVGI